MNTQKRNRTHRPNTNTGNRAPKGRGSFDKNVANEGIFANPRFTYLATSLVGCCVQLQVKNGKCYEGILKTCSPKMDVVLEMAHKVDDQGNNNIPSRDLVHDKIIFNCADILMITAADVDLDYAVKDSFTDTAITKQNGVGEKELRELTPWEPDESDAHHGGGLTDGPSPNGWDANDMFSINERQFNVKSTYDDSLHQYTVPLEKRDTKEYKEKEERAAMLAQEIERSDGYKQRNDLENDGDDEEAKFSAVVRPESSTSNPGKYVPPNKRGQFNQQRNMRHGQPGNASNRMPVHQQPSQPTGPRLSAQHSREDLPPRLAAQQSREDIPPRLAQQSSREDLPPRLAGQHSREDLPPRLAAQHSREDVGPRLAAQQSREDVKINGKDGKEEVKNEESSSPDALSAGTDKAEPVHTSPVSKMERKNPTSKADLLKDLKDFSKNFKLSEDSKDTKTSQENVETKSEHKEEGDKVKSPAPPAEPPKEEPHEDKPDLNMVVSTSKLNPNAPSFVFNPNAKSFQPKQHPQQVTTPPRPQTQSPILQPMPPAMPPMIQPVIFQTAPNFQQLQQSAQPRPPPKRAVVSIQPPRTDFTAAAAQAATGAPLLAHTPFSTVQYHPHHNFMMPTPASYQVGQVMPMPSATPAAGPRMMTPPSGATMDMNQQPGPTMFRQNFENDSEYAGVFWEENFYFGPNGPVPAHIPHQPYHNPQPAHIGPHQQGQQNHPAPSPVQHVVTSQSQSHPPTSNTPQPHNPYQQMSLQGHPPLQPSPHNPASPQTVHMPAVQYQFPIQMQGAAGNQMISQTHPPTSVPHSIHSNMQPHFVMMPHVHNQHNQQSHQFQPHIGQVHQAGVPTALQNTQPGAPFIPQGLTFNRI